MASSASLGFPVYVDGMTWSSLLARTFMGGAATWDSNASATAVNPLSGVFPGPGSPLQVTQAASPAMSVLVNAGYVAVAHLTQGHGVYMFGLLSQATLTVTSNSSGQTRVDLILARVHDNGDNTSSCDMEIVAGTPGAGQPATPGTSLLLATVSVASGASSIVNANITDKRVFTAAPGGILPATTSAAPVAAPGQVIYNTSTATLERLADKVTSTITYSEPGTYTFTVPAGMLPPRMQAWAGGSGGGGYDGSNDVSGSGGPGGEYAEEPAWAGLTTSQVITIVVGAAGAASGVGQSNQTAGGDTTFSLGATVLVHAHAGAAGVSADGQTVPGGTGSTNTIHFNGGAGGPGDPDGDQDAGGGGGGSGGPGAAGQAGATGFQGNVPGGAAVPGGGPGGRGGGSAQPPPYGPGGGGGGAGGAGTGSAAGAAGQAVLTWTVQPAALTALSSADTELSIVDTSTGTTGSSGLFPGDSSSSYGWGIGYGSAGSTGDTDGQIEIEIEEEFTADGVTDFELSAKWGFITPEVAVAFAGGLTATKGQLQVILAIDNNVLDTVCLRCAASSGVIQPAGAGSFSYWTSASRGTTPTTGTHLAQLAIQTVSTYASGLSGAHIGNLASTSTSTNAFGSVPSYYRTALTAENCYLRVSGIASAL